jgi:hypothetical protein
MVSILSSIKRSSVSRKKTNFLLIYLRYDLLIAHKEELAQLITLEQGKPFKESLGEVQDG